MMIKEKHTELALIESLHQIYIPLIYDQDGLIKIFT